LLCLAVLFITFEWWAKPIVAHQASAAMGRKITLKGPMEVAWSWNPRIILEDIRVANTTWSPEPFMSTIRRLSFRIDLRQLFQGQMILSQIDLLESVVRLESSKTGLPNWIFAADASEKPPQKTTDETALPAVKDLVMQNGRLSYQDYSTDHKTTITLAELKAETTGPDEAITVNGTGQWEARPFRLTLHAGSLAALQAPAPYPVQARLQLDPWRVELDGTLRQALELAGVDLNVSLEGAPDPAPDASSPPRYSLRGHLTRRDKTWVLESIHASVGQSNLTGRVIIDMKEIRPFFRADLSAPALDVDHLMAVVAGPKSQAKQATKPSEVDSSSPTLDLEVTRAVNGVLTFQSETIKLADHTLQDLQAEIRLEDGHLTLRPAFAIAGGSVRATVEVEDRTGPLQSAVKAQIQQINMEQMLANFGKTLKSAGILQGAVDLHVSGRTLPQLLESINGNVSLGMTDKANDTDVTVQFATLEDQQTETERLVKITGEGRMQGQPVKIKGRVGSLNTFYQGKTAYPVQADIQLGQTQARLDGTVQEPRRFTGLKANFIFSGPDPATLSQVLPLNLPHLPAYRLEGDLHHEGQTLTVNTFKGAMGKSDLEGTLTLDTGATPMSLRGELHSQRLQIDELTAETAPTQDDSNAPGAKENKDKQAIPDISIDPDLLRLINADVRFKGKRIVGLGPEVRDVSAAVQLRNGELKITPDFVVGGGKVGATIDVVGHSDPMKSLIKATFDGVNLS
jgi:uncharacterized protein involved in outer membrane biogenesis